MCGISFEFFRQAHLHQTKLALADHFRLARHHSNGKPTTGRAERAHAGLPSGDARDKILLRNKTDQLALGLATAVERRRRAGYRRDFKEVAPIHKKSEARSKNEAQY